MSPAEITWRLNDAVHQQVWTLRQSRHRPASLPRLLPDRRFISGLGSDHLDALPVPARHELLAAAQELLDGRWRFFGRLREDMSAPDWSVDPISGAHFPSDRSAFRINYRSSSDPRNVKQVWELSRHHHLTVLACAWRLTADERYAALADSHLRSWWQSNPVGVGVNWSSGIEVGIRLISWVWTRRLLDGWPGAPVLFEENQDALRQIYWHQRHLAAFRSRGSSANNHVIAEAAGQLAASCAFPWFAESDHWRATSHALLQDELARNTFESGVNREQAFDYHGLVAELGFVAGAETEAAGLPLSQATWSLLRQMVDVIAAVVDQSGHPPRQGDSDDGRALLLGDPAANRWASLLALGSAVFGSLSWWPATVPDATSILVSGLIDVTVEDGHRSSSRPSHFADAGLTILRSAPSSAVEVWCRCDGGPHGYLSIAAHAHADALSIELRHGGVELFVDPGTYCYHGEPAFRHYFRSTIGHNTLELAGRDQSLSGGPFLWTQQAHTRVLEAMVDGGDVQRWTAEHDGYRSLGSPATHRRTVILDEEAQSLEILDRLISQGVHAARLAFHVGPSVDVALSGDRAELAWTTDRASQVTATLHLPSQLTWQTHHGELDPILGWYSSGFGQKEPTTTLVGSGYITTSVLRTLLQFSSQPSTGTAV